MAKELPFFKFEVSEWMFGRIQKLPLEVQGGFINLCCKYWHKLGEYSYEDASLDFSQELIDTLHKSQIIGNDENYIYIKFLDAQLDDCSNNSKKQSIKGLKSAAIRAARRQLTLTTVEPRLKLVQPNPTEEKRREDILCIGEVSKFLSIAFSKKYNRDEGGQTGQDIDDLSKELLRTMDKKTIMDQIRCHKLYIGLNEQKPPTKLETIRTALLENDWVKKLKDLQDKEKLQNGLTNEQTRRATRIAAGSDIPAANLGILND